MKKSIIATLLIALVAIGTASYAEEKKADTEQLVKIKKQTHCPVMKKNPVNKKLYVDVKGYRIYVCCKGCIGKVKADPDKYIKELEAKGITLEKTPKKPQAKPEK